MARVVQARRPGRPLRCLRADHRRERHRQGGDGEVPSLPVQARRPRLHLHQLRRHPRGTCSKANCSATRRAPSPAPSAAASASSRKPIGGTLLLDEISEMDVRLQAKLLRAIQERLIDRVGGTKPVPVDIRIIATSNRNLTEAVREGSFREDLLFRLNVVNLKLPAAARTPRRHRRAGRSLRREIRQGQRPRPPRRSRAEARDALLRAPWPGNVRELENTLHRAVLLSGGEIIGPEAILDARRHRPRRSRRHRHRSPARPPRPPKPSRAPWSAAPSPTSSAT